MSKIDNSKKDRNRAFSKLLSPRPLALAVSLALASNFLQTSQAAIFNVENTVDDPNQVIIGSIRNAIDLANASAGNDTIQFDAVLAGSTITLQDFFQLTIGDNTSTDSLTIIGPTAGDMNSITLVAGDSRRVIGANSAPASGAILTLENMTLSGGDVGNIPGGALYSNNMQLILNSVQVTNNKAKGDGGGISVNDAGLELNHSTVSNNSSEADGGGVEVTNGLVTLNQSTISGNSTTGASSKGGGISVFGGGATLTQTTVSNNTTMGNYASGAGLYVTNGNTQITDSTISENKAYGDFLNGGGLYATKGTLTINQSTFSANRVLGANSKGGGIVVRGNVVIKQSTITQNANTSSHASNGIYVQNYTAGIDTVIIHNSILSGNSSVSNGNLEIAAYSTISVSSKNNVFGDPLAELNTSYNDIFSNSPNLGFLNNNGGLTETHLPNATSPVINKGDNNLTTASNYDQRGTGFLRIKDGAVDIGAVETPVPPAPDPNRVLKRNEMVRPILQNVLGAGFVPSPATGLEYTDVAIGDFNADWVEKFKSEGFTEGCDNTTTKFCPDDVVTKDEFAKILLKAKFGVGFTPLPAAGIYTDVPIAPIASFNVEWVEALNMAGFTSGCAIGKYCPKDAVTIEVFKNLLNAAFPP